MTEPTSAQDLFKGRHFDQEIIILCVRWYITFKLSFRDLVQMMAERGITLCHTTILRWVQQYVPEFEKRWNHYARPVGDSWRVDETYVKFNEISGSPQIHRNQGTSENILMLRLELTHHFAKYHSLTRQQGRLNRTRPVQQPASSRNHLTQRQVPQTISDKVVPHQPASCRWHLDSRRCMQDRRWHPDQK
jgi:hypothetical protein